MASKNKKMKFKGTSHITSPQTSDEGCLCKDGSYSTDCCDGEYASQGIGSVDGDNRISNKTSNREPRTNTYKRS